MRKFQVIQEEVAKDPIKPHERIAAEKLKNHFQSDLIFMRRGFGKTPDILVVKTNVIWELKSPTGNGKRTMDNNLRDATGQSVNVIIDLGRCKMHPQRALSRIRGFTKTKDCHIKQLKVLLKSGKVIDILP